MNIRAGKSCPKNYNPADFFIATLAVHPDHEDKSRAYIQGLCDKYDAVEGLCVRDEIDKNCTVKGGQHAIFDIQVRKHINKIYYGISNRRVIIQ